MLQSVVKIALASLWCWHLLVLYSIGIDDDTVIIMVMIIMMMSFCYINFSCSYVNIIAPVLWRPYSAANVWRLNGVQADITERVQSSATFQQELANCWSVQYQSTAGTLPGCWYVACHFTHSGEWNGVIADDLEWPLKVISTSENLCRPISWEKLYTSPVKLNTALEIRVWFPVSAAVLKLKDTSRSFAVSFFSFDKQLPIFRWRYNTDDCTRNKLWFAAQQTPPPCCHVAKGQKQQFHYILSR